MKEKPFKTEIELCSRFLEGVDQKVWIAYAETAGWDYLLVRREDGFQIGIEAKLRLNTDVVNQAIDGDSSWFRNTGPDCRAVMVPDGEVGGLSRICDYLGITVIQVRPPYGRNVYGPAFTPSLPTINPTWRDDEWHEWCPLQRHQLPEYVPDVPAGSKAPVQLTQWKIAAIKIAITLEKRGYVTRGDFKAHHIDHRRWLAPGSGSV